jgi:hypothetical protein
MAREAGLPMFQRRSLDQITQVPDSIISVYVVENHIWAEGGAEQARRERRPEARTVAEFLIDPVRSFLNDIMRQMAAPYAPERKDNPIGQGYWIQAEFGSGKSHLLSFIGALALANADVWAIVRDKEARAGLGRRESLYNFYENGLARKAQNTRGILVAVKTLVGQGGGTIGVGDSGKTLAEYVLDAVAEQFYLETGRSLPLYPTQILADRFLKTGDFERYRSDLEKYLRDPAFFDEEQQEDIGQFLADLQNNPDPGVQRDCGQRLWDFYERYLKVRPQIPMETEAVLKHMVMQLLEAGYAGLLLILDEVSLFMQGRASEQRIEDEKALVVLSNRLAKVENLPVWTVCAAQQAIETKMAGVKNIIARERLDLVPLLNNPDHYYEIALSRVREVTDKAAVEQYFEDYKRSFSWPQALGRDQFARFFPFYPPSIGVVREVSMKLTTVRSALYFMLQTLKTQRKRQSRELLTLWSLFDDVVEYEEDPSGTTKSIANIKTKWPEAWRAYEAATRQLDTITKGPLKVYRNRCQKIIRTLFLYHVANLQPDGLTHEELMNAVMEWRDHDAGQTSDLQDNLDHYEVLADHIARELAQVVKVGHKYRFNPASDGPDPRDLFQKARAEVESDEVAQRQAWEALLQLDGWPVSMQLMTTDLAAGTRSIFRSIAPNSQTDVVLKWHGREITGRVFMRDLLDIAKRDAALPAINSAETGLDYSVFISSTPASALLDSLIAARKDPRVIFWSPAELSASEQSLLIDFAAYRSLVRDCGGRDDQLARRVLEWVHGQLRDQIGTIYRIVPDSYGRGRIAALDHANMAFVVQGELPAILTPLVEQVLDATYVSRELAFDAPAPFNDINAINVINGIVKVGEIPKGARPTREISAAQNYGFALQIMRRPNDRRLDLTDCRYTRDIAAWLDRKLGDGTTSVPASAVYKNFTGINGPNGQHYGLSRRMVQLYLLCLVREGRLRLTLSGRNAPVEAIDYSNIADIEFRTAVLDAIDRVELLKPPAGWDLLAPFAAVLLDDPHVAEVRDDADIRAAVQRLVTVRQADLVAFRSLHAGLTDLFHELAALMPETRSLSGQEETGRPSLTGFLERMTAWETFLAARVDPADPIPFLLHALDQAFGYQVYQSGQALEEEVADLRRRRAEVKHAEAFFRHRDRVLAAARYASFALPHTEALSDLAAALERARQALGRVDELIPNETRLVTELLEPMEEAIRTYTVRYLQVFDAVTAHAEQVRGQIEALTASPAYRALGRLAQVEPLGGDARPALDRAISAVLNVPERLVPTTLTRHEVERRLRHAPQPGDCALTLTNAGEWIGRADATLAECQTLVRTAVLDKANLLHSPALRERLAQGQGDPFIAGLLQTDSPEGMADYLAAMLGSDAGEDLAARLNRYLQKLRVVRLRLADFAPGKRTLERSDVEATVTEFRAFLLSAFEAPADELPLVELE